MVHPLAVRRRRRPACGRSSQHHRGSRHRLSLWKRQAAAGGVALVTFTLTAWAPVAYVVHRNEDVYGARLTNDLQGGEFARAFGEWSRVRGVALTDGLPINEGQRLEVYAVSAASAAGLEPSLEEPGQPVARLRLRGRLVCRVPLRRGGGVGPPPHRRGRGPLRHRGGLPDLSSPAWPMRSVTRVTTAGLNVPPGWSPRSSRSCALPSVRPWPRRATGCTGSGATRPSIGPTSALSAARCPGRPDGAPLRGERDPEQRC